MPGPDLPDLDERLRRLPAALAVDPPAGLAERIAHRGRRRRLRRATAAAVAAALLVGVVMTRSVVLDTPTPVLRPGLLVRDATPGQLARGRWQPLPPMPGGQGGRRMDPAVVWTGQELIVWGGAGHDPVRSHADGAAYDPRTGRWTPLPPAPESQWLLEDRGAAVWTGREMLVWGGLTFHDPVRAPNQARPALGVAFDPARRTWRLLPALPASLRSLAGDHWTAWSGRELLVGGVGEAEGGSGVVAAAYDPAANRWRQLPPSPEVTGGRGHLRARSAIWAGSRLLVWNFWRTAAIAPSDESGATGRPEEEPDGIDLWAYDPAADRWTVLPAPPAEVRRAVGGDASMAWTGREVVIAATPVTEVAGRSRRVGVAGGYDPDRARWTPMAALPRPTARSMLAWAGAAVVEPLGRAVYDPATDRWLRLPASPDRTGVPPPATGSLERALLWMAERDTGDVQLHVLVPAGP